MKLNFFWLCSKVGLSFFFVLLLSSISFGGVIFEENFDSQANWFPQLEIDGCSPGNCSRTPPPTGWDYFRNDELWHPITDGSGFHPTLQISGENFRGSSGKAYTQWNESNDGRGGDGWGADGILAKDLGQDHNELYVRFYVKFKLGFQWKYTVNDGGGFKLFRVYHWNRSGSPFFLDIVGNVAPIYFFDPAHNTYGFRHFHSHRCAPQNPNYYCLGKSYDKSFNFTGVPTFESSLGDGNWHELSWHIKMNSSPGVADGVIEFWTDGVIEYSRSDIEWMGSGSPGGLGWNIVAIGGNAFNSIAPASEQKEQWYAVDDVVISTTPIPPSGFDLTSPNAPGGVTVTIIP